MRSGTSFFDRTVFKKTVTRFWPIWGAYSVFWLIAMPLSGLMMLRMDAQRTATFSDGSSYLLNFARGVANQGELALVMAVAFGVLSAMAVCSHLYNPRSANFFGALPVRREGLFLTHYLAGLAFMIVPNLVIFLLTLLVELAGGAVELPALGFWLAVSCGECFFFYSFAVFCGLFTGHILALPAFYGIFNFLAFGITGLIYLVMNAFYYGFAGFPDWVSSAAKWLTPAYKLESEVDGFWGWVGDYAAGGGMEHREYIFRGLGVVGVYAAAALVLAVCAFLLYRVRRLESAGDVVSVKPMRPVFKYSVAFCSGLAFGMVTAFFLGGGELTVMGSMLVWAVIGYFAAQMLLDKSFRVFKKWKGAAAVAGVFIALFLVVGLDLTGFETYIPPADQVESVYFEGLGMTRGDDGDWVRLEIDDPETIRLIQVLHRAAVDQRDGPAPSDSFYNGLDVVYTLRNGSTVSRQYSLWLDPADVSREGTAAWATERLYQDRDLYWRAYGFDGLHQRLDMGWRLESVELSSYDDEEGRYSDAWWYGAAAREILDAVEEDFHADRIGVRSLTMREDYSWRGRPQDLLSFKVVSGDDKMFWLEIAPQENSSSTRDALTRLADQAVTNGNG